MGTATAILTAELEAARILKRMQEGLSVEGHTGASTILRTGLAREAHQSHGGRDCRLFNIHIEPRLGSKRLAQHDTLDVRAWIAMMASEPLAATCKPPMARTVRNAHSVLSRMLPTAVADRLIGFNPATAERIGKKSLPRASSFDSGRSLSSSSF